MTVKKKQVAKKTTTPKVTPKNTGADYKSAPEEQPAAAPQQEKPIIGHLFGTLGYSDINDIEGFIGRISGGSISDMLLSLNASLRFAQGKGIYSVEESECISASIRTLSKLFTSKQ